MSNNVYHRPINIPFEIDHPQLIPPQGRRLSILKYDIVDDRVLSFIDSCDAYLVHSEYFVFPPGGSIIIHTDDSSLMSMCKLNTFIGTGLLRWFDPLPEFRNKEVSHSDIGTPYLRFKDEEVTLAYQDQMMGDYIINPGIPHNFLNNSSLPCWVVSFLLFDKHTDTFLKFEDAAERFSKYSR